MTTLTGSVSFALPIVNPVPSGAWALIATDGTHHVLGNDSGVFSQIKVCGAETNTKHSTITAAQFRAAVLARSGMSLGSASWSHIVGGPGSPNFLLLGNRTSAPFMTLGIRYRIDADGSVVDEAYYRYTQGPVENNGNFSTGHQCRAQAVIGDNLYYIGDFGSFIFGLQENLVRLPLVGDGVDTTDDAWSRQRFDLPGDMASVNWWDERGAIYQDPDGIGILRYRSTTPANVYHTVILPDGSNTGFNDVSASFGVPFADARYNLAGVFTGLGGDDYLNISINPLGGGLIEVIFGRTFSDNNQFVRLRRFVMSRVGDVAAVDTTTHDFTDVTTPNDLRGAFAYREGDDLQIMEHATKSFIWGTLTIAAPGATPPTILYPDIDTTEDEALDELPEADRLIETQRWLLRTGHIREWGEIAVDDLRVTIKRGVGDSETEPQLWVRANRDNRSWTKWAKRGLGKKGERTMTLTFGGFGAARDWQFEFATTDDCQIELRKAEIFPTPLGF